MACSKQLQLAIKICLQAQQQLQLASEISTKAIKGKVMRKQSIIVHNF